MEHFIFRPARLDDLPILKEFEQGVIAAEQPLSQTLRSGPITYYNLPNLIKSDRSTILLACLQDQPIGCGYVQIRDAKPHFKYSRYAYLGFMYVLPKYRGQGLVAQLIDVLCDWAYSKRVTEIQLEVYAANTPAVRAYEKNGFSQDLVSMRKSIGPKP